MFVSVCSKKKPKPRVENALCSKLGRLGRGVKYRSRRSTWLVLEVCPVAYGTTPLTGSPGWDPPSNKNVRCGGGAERGSSDPNESSPPGNGTLGAPRTHFWKSPKNPPETPPVKFAHFRAPPPPPPSLGNFSQKPGKSHFGHFWNR